MQESTGRERQTGEAAVARQFTGVLRQQATAGRGQGIASVHADQAANPDGDCMIEIISYSTKERENRSVATTHAGSLSRNSTVAGFLERVPLFSAYPFRLQHIAEAAIAVSASRGKVILKPGDPCDGFFVVVYGRVAVALGVAAGERK